METFIKVINIQVLTLATNENTPSDRLMPIIRFELEDGRDFIMGGIPQDIAVAISIILNDVETQDPRMQIQDLVSELAVVDRVEIDLIVPNTDVYQATIYLTPEGFNKQLSYQMIPSHATLLAVLNSAPIFIADTLIRQAQEMREGMIDL